jgi:hypothetical protein
VTETTHGRCQHTAPAWAVVVGIIAFVGLAHGIGYGFRHDFTTAAYMFTTAACGALFYAWLEYRGVGFGSKSPSALLAMVPIAALVWPATLIVAWFAVQIYGLYRLFRHLTGGEPGIAAVLVAIVLWLAGTPIFLLSAILTFFVVRGLGSLLWL